MAGVCSSPGCPAFTVTDGKCATHQRQANRHRHRTTPTKVARTSKVREHRRRAVSAWRTEHGDWCPGYNRPGHTATDLTADDPVAIANGGDPMQEQAILCRSCNSAKGARDVGPSG